VCSGRAYRGRISRALISPLSPNARGKSFTAFSLSSCLVYTAAFLSENAAFVSRLRRERSKSYSASTNLLYDLFEPVFAWYKRVIRFAPLRKFGEFSQLIKKQALLYLLISLELNPLIFDIKSHDMKRWYEVFCEICIKLRENFMVTWKLTLTLRKFLSVYIIPEFSI